MDVKDRPERAGLQLCPKSRILVRGTAGDARRRPGSSRVADAPVMDEGLGGTEVPHASSEKWMLHIERTDHLQERWSQRSSVAESERAGESPRKAL
jgi:hypothetical protein